MQRNLTSQSSSDGPSRKHFSVRHIGSSEPQETDGRVSFGVYAALAAVIAVFAALVYLLGFPFLIIAADTAAILAIALLVYISSDIFSAGGRSAARKG